MNTKQQSYKSRPTPRRQPVGRQRRQRNAPAAKLAVFKLSPAITFAMMTAPRERDEEPAPGAGAKRG